MSFQILSPCSPEGVPNIEGNPTFKEFFVPKPFEKPKPYPFSEPIMKILGKGDYKPKKDYTSGSSFKPFILPALPRQPPSIVFEPPVDPPVTFSMQPEYRPPPPPKPPKRAPKPKVLTKAEKDTIWFKTLTLNKLVKLPHFLR